MTLVLRLAKVIRQRKQAVGSYEKLAGEIRSSNSAKLSVDRRKLKRIAEDGAGFSLTTNDFEALNAYLVQFGEGLVNRPLFETRTDSLFETMARATKAAIVVPGRPRIPESRTNLDVWDFRSASWLVENLSGHEAAPQIVHFVDIQRRGSGIDSPAADAKLLSADSTSICCIGSSRASRIAEKMATMMCGVEREAFQAPRPESTRVPFLYEWSRMDYPSRFASTIASSKRRVLHFNDRMFEQTASRSRGTAKEFGVVLAQRRGAGQVWIVCFGGSGPSSFGCVERLRELPGELELGDAGAPSDTLVVAVETVVRISKGREGDNREFESSRVISEPRYWSWHKHSFVDD